jgi:curved DNA-binding protein CbpA
MHRPGELHCDQRGRFLDYYAILGVAETATYREVEQAYWGRAYTADRGTELPLMNRAWEVLGNKGRRAEYDALRKGVRFGG